jgi:hypothetical protein
MTNNKSITQDGLKTQTQILSGLGSYNPTQTEGHKATNRHRKRKGRSRNNI